MPNGAEDKIADAEFVRGIQWLVKNGSANHLFHNAAISKITKSFSNRQTFILTQVL
ncbi:MAG: hypothetical protein HKP31_05715 [Nitrosopumilus sp.]|nr:hypothetical protein [Nitrosopumilus sp.]